MENSNIQLTPYEGYKKIVKYGESPEVVKAFKDVLGGQAMVYIQSAVNAVRMDERLQLCTPRSIFNAALRAATMRLSCDPTVGQAYLIPYKNKGVMEAQFQAGWKGIQHMALRTGKYQYINVSKVYDGEEVEEDRITGELKITGRMKSPQRDIGLIASFGLTNGYRKSIYMSYEELEEHGKRYSKSYQSGRQDSIWLTNKQLAYHKTILLKLLRTYGYLEPNDAIALDNDDEDASVDLELPAEDKVTIIEEPQPTSIAEINRSLGYEPEETGGKMIDDRRSEMKSKLIETESAVGTEIKTSSVKSSHHIEGSVPKVYVKRPFTPDQLVIYLQSVAKTLRPASEAMEKLFVRKLQELIEDDDYRHLANKFLFGSAHIAEADRTLITAGLKWLNLDDQYQVDPLAKQELDAVIKMVSGENLNESLL